MTTTVRTFVSVSLNPFVEAAAAIGRLLNDIDDAPGPRQPVIGKEQISDFLRGGIPDEARERLTDAVRRWGVVRTIRIALDGSSSGDSLADTHLRALAQDQAFLGRIAQYVQPLYDRFDIHADNVREIPLQSRFWEPASFGRIIDRPLRVEVIPSIFLLPAPRGQLGMLRDDGDAITLRIIYGFTGPIAAKTGWTVRDWKQWFRFGVWHIMARDYWLRRFEREPLPESDLKPAFERLPEKFRMKADLTEYTLTRHEDWKSYAAEHLMTVTKLRLEREIGGEAMYRRLCRWFYSLGRFHVNWFADQWDDALTTGGMRRLFDRWMKDADSLCGQVPRFAGPIGACECPLWEGQGPPRLVFSPSVGAATRRAISIWISNYWRIKPIITVPGEPLDIGGEVNLLLFGLWKDAEWLGPVIRDVPDVFRSAARPLLFASPAGANSERWIRSCLAGTEEEIMGVNRENNYYAGWSSLIDRRLIAGSLEFLANGRLDWRGISDDMVVGSDRGLGG